jgi:DNA adenine methylase
MSSLLRYAGGKSGLAKKIIQYIRVPKGGVYCEPFVGGGSVALLVAKQNPDIQILLNDLDPEVANFWSVITSSSNEAFFALVERVRECQPTIELFREFLKAIPTNPAERAFRFLYLNRCSRVESNGKRPLGGWDQKKPGEVASRWNGKRLVKELIDARWVLQNRTTVYNKDFAAVMMEAQANWVCYLDPPYFGAGNELYNYPWTIADHARLRDLLKTTLADWVLSYDDNPRIAALYTGESYALIPASYSMSKRKAQEVVITPARFAQSATA